MKQRRVLCLTVSLLLALGFCVPVVSARGAQGPILLIVPDRFRVVQLSFDVAYLRPLVLLSYRGDADTRRPLLHVWHQGKWVYISAEDYEQGAFFRQQPSRVLIVGREEDVSPTLVQASSWCAAVKRLGTLDIAGLVNSLGAELQLRPAEIKWLAARYGLTVIERNAERRRSNRSVRRAAPARPPKPKPAYDEAPEPIAEPVAEPEPPVM
ncbi:MAG: hypothetical protein JXR37_30175 [Kiritimatiellae bacterium]|nr:hypothetical protein [Kiritimatiellia bacterium]